MAQRPHQRFIRDDVVSSLPEDKCEDPHGLMHIVGVL